MTDSSPNHNARLAELADQFGFSEDAVLHLLDAVSAGGGDMAMFDHPELAGPGQWMRGGLIMITDPANHVLRNCIDALCNALSDGLHQNQVAELRQHRRIHPTARAWDTGSPVRDRWWPEHLGEPTAIGEQGGLAYAYFDQARRLAIRRDGQVEVYDTGAHHITGISQSQHNGESRIVFTSPLGEVPLERLEESPGDFSQPAARLTQSEPLESEPYSESQDILDKIERLGDLHGKGVLTEAEFTSKKQELLARL